MKQKKKLKPKEIMNLIILSYEKFFRNLNSYNFLYFKKRAGLMVLDK